MSNLSCALNDDMWMEQEERKSSKGIRGLKSLFQSYSTEAIGLEVGSGVAVFDKWEIDYKRINDDTSTVHPPTHPSSI